MDETTNKAMKTNAFNPGEVCPSLSAKFLQIMNSVFRRMIGTDKNNILMRVNLIIIIMTTCLLQVSASGFAQRITYSERNATLDLIFRQIKKQTGYKILYSDQNVNGNFKMNVNFQNVPLTEVLETCLKNSGLTYEIDQKNIVIKQSEITFLDKLRNLLSNIDVKGKVFDESGKPLPGAVIKVKGKGQAASTDAAGNFHLSNVEENAVLTISFIGYITKEVTATKDLGTIALELDNAKLEEVVVVGYGTQKKTSLTGAVATITASQINDRPVTSMQNALQGVSPGLTVIQRPGDVSSVGTITLRGRSNLGSSVPMYIIDGVPATSTQFASLNPNDVESISVLKDAASASIYGSRAANGVLVVTTKRGQGGDGTPSIELNTNYGIQSPTRLPKYTNATDYATLYNEALTNAGKAPLYSAAQIQKFADGSDPDNYANTDWYKLALKKNPKQSNSTISISSAGKATNYYFSASYLNQESLVPNKDQNRYTVNLNADTRINSMLKIGTIISYYRQNFDTRGGELNWTSLNRLTPVLAARQSDGSWGTIAGGALSSTLAADNVLRRMAEAGKSYNRNNYLQTAATAVLTPVKGLSVNGLVSLKTTNTNSWAFTNTMDPLINFITKAPLTSTAVTINELKEKWGKVQNFLVQGYADYQYTAGDHFAKIMVGASQESNITRYAYLGRKNFPNNDMTTIVSGSSAAEDVSVLKDDDNNDILGNSTSDLEWAMRSFFGRFNYSFKNRYLLEANLRMDYSSRFDPAYRKAVFPSFSAGWRISQEGFMKNISWINDLKLRGSWGSLGNQDAVPLGNYFSLLNLGYSYSFDGVPYDGVSQSFGVNQLATWEKVYMTNIGLDFSTLKGKLNVTADYYIKNSKDILIKPTGRSTYALTPPFENLGSVRNKGLELNLNYNDMIGNDFKYTIGVNLSKISNKITGLGGDNSRTHDTYYIDQLGASVGSFYGYQAEGLFKDAADVSSHAFQSAATGPGDIKYKDLNGDGKIDATDRTVIGNDVPFLNYGVSLSGSYKGFSLEILTYGVANVKTYFDSEAGSPFFNSAGIKEPFKNRWTKENPDPNAEFPRLLRSQDGPQNTQISSFWLFSGSYFRVRGLTLGYTLPTLITHNLKAQSIRFFVTANNPFTYMADKRLADYDPESGSGRGGYPGVKTWSLGASIKF